MQCQGRLLRFTWLNEKRETSMGKTEHIEQAILAESLPVWVDRVDVEEMLDADGEPSLEVRIVVQKGVQDVFSDGAKITSVTRAVHRALTKIDIDLWPYTSFISADELEAA